MPEFKGTEPVTEVLGMRTSDPLQLHPWTTDLKSPVGEQLLNEAYASLKDVLDRAYKQASEGKGKERHAQDQAFEEQPMQTISKLLDTEGGMLYQSIKKMQESRRLPTTERRVAEILGAIVYAAGAIIYLEAEDAGQ